MTDFLIPAGAYLLCGVDDELRGSEIVAFTVPSGVYYSAAGVEVYVGDFDDENAVGRVGLIPAAVALDAGFDVDDLVVFDAGAVARADEKCFSFGSLVFEI